MRVNRRRCLAPPANLPSGDARNATAFSRETPPRDQLARRAYQKWLTRGCPDNTDVLDWLEAEAELKEELHGRPRA